MVAVLEKVMTTEKKCDVDGCNRNSVLKCEGRRLCVRCYLDVAAAMNAGPPAEHKFGHFQLPAARASVQLKGDEGDDV